MSSMVDGGPKAIERAFHVSADPLAIEYLSFALAGESYALELARIQSIIMVPTLTEVPRAQSFVLGICSVRGSLVTVLDLRRRMSLPEAPLSRHARILLTQSAQGETLGLLVDAVRYVVRPELGEIELTQGVLGSDLPDYVLAIARLHHEAEQKRRKKRTEQTLVRASNALGTKPQGARPTRSKKEAEVIVILDLDIICGLGKGDSAR